VPVVLNVIRGTAIAIIISVSVYQERPGSHHPPGPHPPFVWCECFCATRGGGAIYVQ
jgi:hypothetical protein